MSEDEKMFHIGVWLCAAAVVLTVVLQVCYRTQNRVLKRVRAGIATTSQQIAVYETQFAAFVRPEVLRDRVTLNNVRAETIGFHKNITIDELPNRE